MHVQKSAEQYLDMLREQGFEFDARNVSYPYLWWSPCHGLGLLGRWGRHARRPRWASRRKPGQLRGAQTLGERRGMIRLLLIGCLLLLSACASQPPLPEKTPTLALPLQLHVQRMERGPEPGLAGDQREGNAIRWSMMDPLGIPWPGRNSSMVMAGRLACCRPTPGAPVCRVAVCPGFGG